jgi:hypothetical protein
VVPGDGRPHGNNELSEENHEMEDAGGDGPRFGRGREGEEWNTQYSSLVTILSTKIRFHLRQFEAHGTREEWA